MPSGLLFLRVFRWRTPAPPRAGLLSLTHIHEVLSPACDSPGCHAVCALSSDGDVADITFTAESTDCSLLLLCQGGIFSVYLPGASAALMLYPDTDVYNQKGTLVIGILRSEGETSKRGNNKQNIFFF